jgi:tRNA(fMet)-specific endonuclease VapC
MRMLLDTTFLIDLMVGDQKAVAKARELEKEGIPIALGTPSVFELWSGISQSRKPEDQKRKIKELLTAFIQYHLDTESAVVGGSVYGALAARGETIDPEDAMLAGIAKVHHEKILTRNVKHFSKIEESIVETY